MKTTNIQSRCKPGQQTGCAMAPKAPPFTKGVNPFAKKSVPAKKAPAKKTPTKKGC